MPFVSKKKPVTPTRRRSLRRGADRQEGRLKAANARHKALQKIEWQQALSEAQQAKPTPVEYMDETGGDNTKLQLLQ